MKTCGHFNCNEKAEFFGLQKNNRKDQGRVIYRCIEHEIDITHNVRRFFDEEVPFPKSISDSSQSHI